MRRWDEVQHSILNIQVRGSRTTWRSRMGAEWHCGPSGRIICIKGKTCSLAGLAGNKHQLTCKPGEGR